MMKENTKQYIKKNYQTFFLLAGILLVGVFLRIYHFHDWLHFGSDQSRDASIVQQFINGQTPLPELGPEAASTGFFLGPVYYYFQIASAELFGTSPQVFAYPDVIFSILSILLFYFFLKKYFHSYIPLALTGIYAISFYAIQYSRFAWNTNSIPFFSMLFIVSLFEVLFNQKKVAWWWPVSLGIAIGIGMQLHTVTLLLFLAMTFLSFVFSMKMNWRTWNNWAVIFAIVLALNAGQISHEIKTDYLNTHAFIASSLDKSKNTKDKPLKSLEIALLCHVQANAVMISSIGDNDKCSYDRAIKNSKKIRHEIGLSKYRLYLVIILCSIIFSMIGYIFFIWRFLKEKDRQGKYLLGIIIAYSLFSFLLLVSALNDAPLRYFIHLIFVPFFFMGFIAEYLIEKMQKNAKYAILLLLLFLAIANILSIYSEANKLASNTRGDSGYVVLGEIEPMIEFMSAHAQGQEAYIFGRNTYFSTYASPLIYVAEQKHLVLIRGNKIENVPAGAPVFYIWKKPVRGVKYKFNNREVEQFKVVGNLGIYKLKN